MNSYLKNATLAVTLVAGIGGAACRHDYRGASSNYDRDGRGSQNAHQRGYDAAYRDGADRGRLDRARTDAAYDFDSEDYRSGDRGYATSMGDRGQYQQGYREGYKAGYDDAYKGRSGPASRS